MAITEEEIHSQIMKAEDAFSKNEHTTAVNILENIIKTYPKYAPAYRKLAAIYLRTSSAEEALPLINKTLELQPNDPQNWNILGHYHVRFKIWDKALEAFKKSLELSGDTPQIEYEISKIYRSMGDQQRLFSTLQNLVEKYPDTIVFSHEYGVELYKQNKLNEALALYEHIIHTNPINKLPITLINTWRELMQKFDRSEEVLEWMEKQYSTFPTNPTLAWLMGVVYIDMQNYIQAEKMLLKAYTLDPNNTEVLYTLAYFYYTHASIDKSLYYFDKFFEKKPLSPKALRVAAGMKKLTYEDTLFQHLNYAASHLCEFNTYEKSEIHYALGKAYDDVGELKTAFAHFELGGKFHSEGKKSGIDMSKQLLTLYKKHFNKNYYHENFAKSTNTENFSSKKPIFIIGMPRSGTTLIESILSVSDDIFGAGELPYLDFTLHKLTLGDIKFNFDYSIEAINENSSHRERANFYIEKIKSISPEDANYVIDKMPENYKYAGFIPLIFSDASIIHTRRHPMEICLSAYRIMFTQGHYWSDDLRTMGRYYRLYHEIMQHWKKVLPEGTILDVRYEDMVNDPETQSKRMAAHIGIEWDPKCLAFHKSNKSVRTASALQVKQPMYKDSMNRWRKYEPYLQPLLNEIGDLVEEYEAELVYSRQ